MSQWVGHAGTATMGQKVRSVLLQQYFVSEWLQQSSWIDESIKIASVLLKWCAM